MRLIILALLASLAFSQPAAVFPTAVADWGDLLIAAKAATATLTADIDDDDLAIPVTSGAQYVDEQEDWRVAIGSLAATFRKEFVRHDAVTGIPTPNRVITIDPAPPSTGPLARGTISVRRGVIIAVT